MSSPRVFTAREQAARVTALARGLAGGDINDKHANKVDRINRRAEERFAREYTAWQVEFEQAKSALALARTAERCAARTERPEAKKARKKAEDHLRRVERAEPRA